MIINSIDLRSDESSVPIKSRHPLNSLLIVRVTFVTVYNKCTSTENDCHHQLESSLLFLLFRKWRLKCKNIQLLYFYFVCCHVNFRCVRLFVYQCDEKWWKNFLTGNYYLFLSAAAFLFSCVFAQVSPNRFNTHIRMIVNFFFIQAIQVRNIQWNNTWISSQTRL